MQVISTAFTIVLYGKERNNLENSLTFKHLKKTDVVTPLHKTNRDHGNMFRVMEIGLWAKDEHMIKAYGIYNPEHVIELPESQLMLWEDYL